MQMVKIKFTDPATEAEGFVTLAKRVGVICFANRTYEIPKSALSILDEKSIAYEVVVEEGFDSVCNTLRNSLASQI